MIKLLLIAALLSYVIRKTTGAWPWEWMNSKPSTGTELARARRLLHVSDSASAEEIRNAYRRLAAETHPDRGGSTAQLAALTEARDFLLAHHPEIRS